MEEEENICAYINFTHFTNFFKIIPSSWVKKTKVVWHLKIWQKNLKQFEGFRMVRLPQSFTT